jgi:hypothetical protein
MTHQFESMQELVNSLTKQLSVLESGHLSSSKLDKMVNNSREIYERLLVIRHKAYEAYGKNGSELKLTIDAIVHDSDSQSIVIDSSPKKVEPFKLNFAPRQNDLTKNQISLIDSIEEINKQQKESCVTKTLHDKLVDKVEVSTLAEKMERLPIGDLKKAIGLNQKFLFINELFNKDQDVFESSLSTLNNFSSVIEADNFINNNLKARFNWDTSNENVKEFFELVERRYL